MSKMPRSSAQKKDKKRILKDKTEQKSANQEIRSVRSVGKLEPHLDSENKQKILKLASRYQFKVQAVLNPKKKLLVLDLDHTLYNTKVEDSQPLEEILRPCLHFFLQKAYEQYNLVLWSASRMSRIRKTMKYLGLAKNTSYRFIFYMCIDAMLKVGPKQVKPLGVIWKNFPDFDAKNTLIIDDKEHNFLLNPQNGLWIKPYTCQKTSTSNDKSLLFISSYLEKIAKVNDFTKLNHKEWFSYV